MTMAYDAAGNMTLRTDEAGVAVAYSYDSANRLTDRRKSGATADIEKYAHDALGRLGYPIRAVAVPGHTFCRWDDPVTGERLNIEAANLGGLTEHDDEYYRHWPYEVDPRWEREHHVLKSLTMREYAAVMVGCLGAYYQVKEDYPSAIRWDALA